MKRLIVLLCLLLVVGCFAGETPSKGLSAYKGKNLRKLDEKTLSVFLQDFRALTGDKPEEKQGWGGFEPWWVNPINSGEAAWCRGRLTKASQ